MLRSKAVVGPSAKSSRSTMNETPVPRKLALSLLAVAFASCESAPSSPVIAVDSAGVRVVVSDPSASDATCAVGEEPLLVVGDREDDPAHLFGRVVGAARLSDGSVAVVDPTVNQVRVFDETGEHLRSLGRLGDGPGEFKNALARMGLPRRHALGRRPPAMALQRGLRRTAPGAAPSSWTPSIKTRLAEAECSRPACLSPPGGRQQGQARSTRPTP